MAVVQNMRGKCGEGKKESHGKGHECRLMHLDIILKATENKGFQAGKYNMIDPNSRTQAAETEFIELNHYATGPARLI